MAGLLSPATAREKAALVPCLDLDSGIKMSCTLFVNLVASIPFFASSCNNSLSHGVESNLFQCLIKASQICLSCALKCDFVAFKE